MKFAEYQQAVDDLPYGKRLPTARYVFANDETPLPEPLGALIHVIRQKFAPSGPHNLIKLHTESFKISLLHYPGFLDDPHPALANAVVIDLVSGQAKQFSYSKRDNPPILHRKETMLPLDHPMREQLVRLSLDEEKAGLYAQTSRIGFRANWERLLLEKGLAYDGNKLIVQSQSGARADPDTSGAPVIHRHRTAISRTELSKPVREALNLGLLREGKTSFFDFGCGHGADVRKLEQMGFSASGWDPVYAPNGERTQASVVNLGFVLNVIEDPSERIETLSSAWSLTQEVLIVSTMVEGQEGYYGCKTRLNDGIVTVRGTFQKYFAQVELQMLIEETLQTEADALGLGIFVVFRDRQARHAFLFSRIRRDLSETTVHQKFWRPSPSRRPGFEQVYAQHQPLLDSLWLRMLALGRTPGDGEFEHWTEVCDKLGSRSRVLRQLLGYFGEEVLEEARRERKDDLIVFLALAQFRRKVPFNQLPESVQHDVKAFFGSHQNALREATELLWSAGQSAVIEAACEALPFGYATEEHLTLHRSLLDELPPVLRVYVHCSSIIYGNPRDADLIKIHKHSGKVTLQFFDDFDGKALPELFLRVKVNLRTLRAQVFDHSQPPHRQLLPFKERFLHPEHKGYREMHRFSKKLLRLGLTLEATANGVSPEVLSALLKQFTR